MPIVRCSTAADSLADPSLRDAIVAFVRRRVPMRDVDDVVQTVLCDALATPDRPTDPGELRRWILGVARHKVVDHHRRTQREPSLDLPEIPAGPPPVEERELVRWAEKQAGPVGDAQKTLDWMAREGEGEKLESIAAEERVPATRIRQRVSRMRRWMKDQWLAELAAVAALAGVTIVVWWLYRDAEQARVMPPEPAISSEPETPAMRAGALRREAVAACDRRAWRDCLEGLDRAKAIDSVGDETPSVRAARSLAEDNLRHEAPAPTSSSAPRAPDDAKPQLPGPTSKEDSSQPSKPEAPILKSTPKASPISSAVRSPTNATFVSKKPRARPEQKSSANDLDLDAVK